MNRPAFECTSRYHQRMGFAGRLGLVVTRGKRLITMALLSAVVGATILHGHAAADAQPSDKSDKSDKKPSPSKPGAANAPTAKPSGSTGSSSTGNNGNNGKPKVFDFTGLDIAGRLRTPQLMYFLERANEELERASLQKRSFVPSMVRSIDDEAL